MVPDTSRHYIWVVFPSSRVRQGHRSDLIKSPTTGRGCAHSSCRGYVPKSAVLIRSGSQVQLVTNVYRLSMAGCNLPPRPSLSYRPWDKFIITVILVTWICFQVTSNAGLIWLLVEYLDCGKIDDRGEKYSGSTRFHYLSLSRIVSPCSKLINLSLN